MDDQGREMPICIAGMHRSGTSMLARLLSTCGVCLGPESDLMRGQKDNPDGFFENVKFVELNEQLLSDCGGGWDCPPAEAVAGTANGQCATEDPRIDAREQALALLQELRGARAWGWKDPRNSLTLRFWKSLLPDLKVVACLRNPLEVAVSLHNRNHFSLTLGLQLWHKYNERILDFAGTGDQIITHYDAWFHRCEAEARRLLDFLGVPLSPELLRRCCQQASSGMRHNRFHVRDLEAAGVSLPTRRLYERLCAESDWADNETRGGSAHRLSDNGATTGAGPDAAAGDEGEARVANGSIRMKQLDRSFMKTILLQREVEERTLWAQNVAAQSAAKEARIAELQGQIDVLRAQLDSARPQDPDSLRETLRSQGDQIQALTTAVQSLGEAARADDRASLHRSLRDQDARIQELTARVEKVSAAGARLSQQADDILATVEDLQVLVASQRAGADGTEPLKRLDYRRLLREIRHAVRANLPEEATVLVVGKGDDALLDLDVRQVWHFPQDAQGRYPGFPPADSGSAIVQLEALRSKGADYLLFPKTSLWWLDHYAGLREHLERHARPLVRGDDSACTIYALRSPRAEARGSSESGWEAFGRLLDEARRRIGREPAVLDWHTGCNLASRFPRHTIFSPFLPEGQVPRAVPPLPYLDQTVDVVAVASTDDAVIAHARRVATGAIVVFNTGEKATGLFETRWVVEQEAPPLMSTSIVIPSYNGIGLTEACLAATAETLPDGFRGEIIVVDDASTDDTQERMRRWVGSDARVRYERNPQNMGFLMTCNRGAELATGEVVILLNNDTLPQQGWLEALLETFRDRPDAGAVGGKLVYPDGRLQEAGGVIFSDGSAANFGRGDYEVDAPLYNYVREVDYVTGALIATRRDLFNRLGGLDTRYRPIYYEETDYCFRLRENGYKIYYQPASVVIHLEGVTCGTDTSSGLKRYQVLNREKFVQRWRAALGRQPANPGQFGQSAWQALAVREEAEPVNDGGSGVGGTGARNAASPLVRDPTAGVAATNNGDRTGGAIAGDSKQGECEGRI